MREWYSAALFCLDVADYRGSTEFMHVQAIGILQMCSNAIGDTVRCHRLMSTAVRIANDLGMPFQQRAGVPSVQTELSRRLWWVFIICEWYVATKREVLSLISRVTN